MIREALAEIRRSFHLRQLRAAGNVIGIGAAAPRCAVILGARARRRTGVEAACADGSSGIRPSSRVNRADMGRRFGIWRDCIGNAINSPFAGLTVGVPEFAAAVGVSARGSRCRFDDEAIARLQRLHWRGWGPELIKRQMDLFHGRLDARKLQRLAVPCD